MTMKNIASWNNLALPGSWFFLLSVFLSFLQFSWKKRGILCLLFVLWIIQCLSLFLTLQRTFALLKAWPSAFWSKLQGRQKVWKFSHGTPGTPRDDRPELRGWLLELSDPLLISTWFLNIWVWWTGFFCLVWIWLLKATQAIKIQYELEQKSSSSNWIFKLDFSKIMWKID